MARVTPRVAGALILRPNEETHGQGLGPQELPFGATYSQALCRLTLSPQGNRFSEAGMGCGGPRVPA